MARVGSKHTDPLFSRLYLLEYLTKYKDVTQTRAGFVMEKNGRHAETMIKRMEREGLITVEKCEDEGWIKSKISITPKGYEIYQKLVVMNTMLIKPSKPKSKAS